MAEDSLTGDVRPGAAAASRAPQRAAKRPGIGLFLRQILDELRKVVRPTRHEWTTYTIVVITFVVVIMMLVFGMDAAFAKLVALVFGGSGS